MATAILVMSCAVRLALTSYLQEAISSNLGKQREHKSFLSNTCTRNTTSLKRRERFCVELAVKRVLTVKYLSVVNCPYRLIEHNFEPFHRAKHHSKSASARHEKQNKASPQTFPTFKSFLTPKQEDAQPLMALLTNSVTAPSKERNVPL